VLGGVEALLHQLGPAQLRRGGHVTDPAAAAGTTNSALYCATGLGAVDALLGGGFPRGRLAEISGPHSSGRTSLGLALLSETTRAGECAAIIDPGNGFDPPSAHEFGVNLARVLWARPRGWRETLRAVERLLETEGFPLVLLDLAAGASREAHRAPWLRLSRLATSTRTALIVLSSERLTGARAQVAIEMEPTRAHFVEEGPALLEAIESRAALVRHRTAPTGSTRIQLSVRAA